MSIQVKQSNMNGPPQPVKSPKSEQSVNEVKDQLYKTFNEALNKTKEELAEVKQKLQEYDEKYQASSTVKKQGQKASDYLHATLEEIKQALEDLTKKAEETFVEAKEFTKEAVIQLWEFLKKSIEKLKALAIEFDEKYHVSERIADVTAPLLNQLKYFGKSLDQASEAIKDATKSGRSYLIGAAASLEHKYKIESKLTDIDQKFKIVEKAKSLQEKGEEFLAKKHIMERVKQLDEKMTGSKAGEFFEQGVKLVTEEIGKVQQEYETAKSK